jgi:hypothetical protein
MNRIQCQVLCFVAVMMLAISIAAQSRADEPRGREVQLAALPALSSQAPTAPTPMVPIQAQTCGCTPPPNPKQKLMTNNSGKLSCTVTTLACWAP